MPAVHAEGSENLLNAVPMHAGAGGVVGVGFVVHCGGVTQILFTHFCPDGHCGSLVHCTGVMQILFRHTFPDGQSVSFMHCTGVMQALFLHTCPDGHPASLMHCRPVAVTVNDFVPCAGSDAELKSFSVTAK